MIIVKDNQLKTIDKDNDSNKMLLSNKSLKIKPYYKTDVRF